MQDMIIKLIQLIKDAESISNSKDGSEKKVFVVKMLINAIGSEKYNKYEFIISELIESLIWLNNNKEIKLFIRKNCHSCIS